MIKINRKQSFLDQESNSEPVKITQEMLRTLSKTQIETILRGLRLLDKSLYQTWMKSKAFHEIMACLIAAQTVIKDDTNETNKMED